LIYMLLRSLITFKGTGLKDKSYKRHERISS
jgi:hypothetical protein